jgi:hypothetical protein
VVAGDSVRIRVDGYVPGERVTIGLAGTDEVLDAATADEDGAIVAEVLIPAWTASGSASLDVVGTSSTAVADVPLEVAAVAAPSEEAASRVPLLAAAGALAATGAGLLSTTRRRRSGRG